MESAEFFVQSKSSLHDFVSYLITFARYNNSVTEIFYEQGWEHPLLLILEDTWKIQIFWFHIALSHEKYESPSNAVQERAHTFLFFFYCCSYYLYGMRRMPFQPQPHVTLVYNRNTTCSSLRPYFHIGDYKKCSYAHHTHTSKCNTSFHLLRKMIRTILYKADNIL